MDVTRDAVVIRGRVTHQRRYEGDRLYQVVSPRELRKLLRAEGLGKGRPGALDADDDWLIDDDHSISPTSGVRRSCNHGYSDGCPWCSVGGSRNHGVW